MLIVKLWHYFRGYVIIKIEGFTLEKFLNLVVKEEIFIWDIFRESTTCLYLKVSKKDFMHLKNIIRKVSCRAEIIEKKGFPFLLVKMQKRKFLVGGATIVIALIYVLTSLIWTIEITGNEKVSSSIILKQLEDLGMVEGEFKYKIPEKEIEDKLLILNTELAYVNIIFKGIKAQIEIVEKEKPPPQENTGLPTNIIADRDGILHRILVYGGEPVVREGDLVKEGDLLISGLIQINEEEFQQGHAWGDVYAKTWYELEVSIPMKIEQENKDKNKIIEKTLVIGSEEVTPIKVEEPNQNFDKIVKSTPLLNFLGMEVPIYIKSVEYNEVAKELTEDELKKVALKQVQGKIEKERKHRIEIINSKVEIISQDKDHAKIGIFIEAIEKISLMEEIL